MAHLDTYERIGSPVLTLVPLRAKVYLCSSYALAAWAWRSWEFIVALVLIELYPDSLLMVSAYGLLDNLARVLLGPVVGSYEDRSERLPGCVAMLRLQNLCIGGSALAALVLLSGAAAARAQAAYWTLMWVLTLLGAASSAGSTGVSIAVEREAVRALCGDDAPSLARLNAVMRAIDLSALLAAPLAAGLLMTGAGPFAAVAAMACYCCGAYLPERALLGAAFRAAPVLGQPKARGAAAAAAATSPDTEPSAPPAEDERTGLLTEDRDGDAAVGSEGAAGNGSSCILGAGQTDAYTSLPSMPSEAALSTATSNYSALETCGEAAAAAAAARAAAPAAPTRLRVMDHAVRYGESWRVYVRQPVLLPCVALALLYMTVLSLGFLMTSYLKWSGMSEAEVSAYRGVGALTGLAATAIFPPLAKHAGLRFCAAAGITYQLACLAAGVLPTVMAAVSAAGDGGSGKPPVRQIRVLVAGLVSSRTGLWLYDLAVTQLIQEEVRQDLLGSVCGVQSSLQAFFEMMSFVAGLTLSNPAAFHWLMLGSVGSVASAAALVWCYVCCVGPRVRGLAGAVAVGAEAGGSA